MKKVMVMAALLLFIFGGAAAQDDMGTVTVDASAALGTISPYVFGVNMGHHAIVPVDLMPQAQALNLKYVRFGGGTSDMQDLQRFNIDIFVLLTRQMGAEPAMTVRLLGGTPEDAADMVRYANIDKDYNIRYWSIGNEPNLFEPLFDEPYTTEDLNRDWRAMAEAMLEVDPEILLVGPDITQYVPLSIDDAGNITYLERALGGWALDPEGRDWLVEFLRANGDLVDVVSIHRYPYPGAGGSSIANATVDGLRENSREWDVIIPNLRRIVREAAGRDIPLAVTEFNSNSTSSSGGEASLDSFYNALWIADVLGRMIKNQVEYVAYWDIQGIGARTWGLLTSDSVRPSYSTYLLYTHFGTELVDVTSADPDVPVYGALNADGDLTLMVINLGPDEVTKALDLTGFTPGGEAEVWRFDAEHNAEQIESVDVTGGITVPGQSATVYIIPAG